MKTSIKIAVTVAIVLTSFSFREKSIPSEASVSASAVDLKTNMRKLWEDHVTWTRNVIFCIMDDLPGTDQAVARLLKNRVVLVTQLNLLAMIKIMSHHCCGHTLPAADLLKAVKKGDKTAQDAVTKKWFENADEISRISCKGKPELEGRRFERNDA